MQTIQPVQINLDFDFDLEDCITIQAYDTTEKDMKKREKFNRAKTKREFRKQVEEELYEVDDDYEER